MAQMVKFPFRQPGKQTDHNDNGSGDQQKTSVFLDLRE